MRPSNSAQEVSTSNKEEPVVGTTIDPEANDDELLEQIVDYYHERLLLPESKKAHAMLKELGLWDEAIIKKLRIGFADRSLCTKLPKRTNPNGAKFRQRVIELGVFRQSGHEHLNGAITLPYFNGHGNVTEIYGRKVIKNLRKGTAYDLFVTNALKAIWNAPALRNKEVVLCRTPIDALTLYMQGVENVTFSFSDNGISDELLEAFVEHSVQSVKLAYPADDAGYQYAESDAEKLTAKGLEVFRVRVPVGLSVNDFSQSHGADALKSAIAEAQCVSEHVPPKEEATTAPPAAEDEAAEKEQEAIIPELPSLEAVGEHHELNLGGRRYRISGLFKNGGIESLKVTLRLWHVEDNGTPLFHVDKIDLCKDVDRRRFCERGAYECRLDDGMLKRDLGKLLLACEQTQDIRFRDEIEPNEVPEVELTPEEKDEAMQLLTSPNLIDKLDQSFHDAGIVGEKSNRLAAYLTATSRLLTKPLAVIIQSTSAAGKTTLMEAVLAFFPEEAQIKYSAMTGQSLYYLGEKNLKHKILAIAEEEGAKKASYALKLLQSEGELTIASTGKDGTTGRMKTEEYHVEGPVSIVLTTTSVDIDEELMNRCLILTVDESKEQTERIHIIQRKARTIEGLRLKKKRKRVLTLLQNAQRLLKPVEVVNPYADQLSFIADRTRTRRDHEKYLTLIDTVTLLHQHQRALEDDADAGLHIKTTLEDIAIANKLAPEILGRSLDELPPQTRRLLEAIKELVRAECQEKHIDQDSVFFSRRDVRESTGWSEFQVRTHIKKLENLEYLVKLRGRQGLGCVYMLLVDSCEPEGIAHVGLIGLEQINKISA